MTWRYRGGPGSGVLADVGSHIVDTAEMLCGPVVEVSGASFVTAITQRPVPAGATVGHGRVETTGELEAVDNEDVAVFTARFENGAVGSFSASRIAHAEPNGLGFEVFGTGGSATFDVQRMSEFQISDGAPLQHLNGRRRVYVGPEHPYIARASRWMRSVSGTDSRTCSSSRPGPSSTRSPVSNHYRAVPASPTACTACKCSRRSPRRPPMVASQ